MAAGAASSSSSTTSSPAGQAPGGGGGGAYHHRSRFGDTTLTKVFVGGLAWETPSRGLHDHFRAYGDILEAVVITDRETGRSKGYGFVTFRDPEAARQAVQEPNPVIAGRRANCNIASVGPPRPSPQRGRAPRGSRSPDQQHLGPPPYIAGGMQSRHHHHHQQQQMAAPPHAAAMFYPPPHYGYWYPPDYPYQQAMYNPPLQHYYAQLYGQASSSTSPYPYMGYIPGPTAGFSPVQQEARPPPPLFRQPAAAQAEAAFQTGPTLPPNFRLQLPPRAASNRHGGDASGSQQDQTASAAEDPRTDDDQEASAPVRRSDSDTNTSN